MLAKDLKAGQQFYRNDDTDALEAIKDAELDKYSQTRSYKILCEDIETGEQFYWLFTAIEEVEIPDWDDNPAWNSGLMVFVQWGPMLPSGHAGWPFITCDDCQETFISKDVDLVIEGAQQHVEQAHHKLHVAPRL